MHIIHLKVQKYYQNHSIVRLFLELLNFELAKEKKDKAHLNQKLMRRSRHQVVLYC